MKDKDPHEIGILYDFYDYCYNKLFQGHNNKFTKKCKSIFLEEILNLIAEFTVDREMPELREFSNK